MNRVLTILFFLAGFVAEAQTEVRWIRFLPQYDTAVITQGTNRRVMYLNGNHGKIVYTDNAGYHRLSTVGSGGGGSSVWGGITGTLSSQTDLQNALNLKANLASPTFTGSPVVPGYAPLASPTFTGTPTVPGYATLASPTFTGTPVVPGYAPLASPTFTGLATAPLFKMTSGGPGVGKVLTSDADGDASWVQAIEGFTTITSDYTLALANITDYTNSGVIRITGSGDKDITVPTNASVAFPLRSKISFVNEGTDTVRFIEAGGVTIVNDDIEIAPGEFGFLFQSAANNWVASGGGTSGTSGGIADCKTATTSYSGNHTLTLDDVSACNNNGIIRVTGSSNVNITVPLNASVDFEVFTDNGEGTAIGIYNATTDDTVKIVFAGGITGKGHDYLSIDPGQGASLFFAAVDVVDLIGTTPGSGSAGGVGNTAPTNGIPKTDASSDLVASGIYSPSAGNVTYGSSGLSGSRTETIESSSTPSNKLLVLQGSAAYSDISTTGAAGSIRFNPGSGLISVGIGLVRGTVAGADGASAGGILNLDGGDGTTSDGNIGMFTRSTTTDYKSGQEILFIHNNVANPTTGTADGVFMYAKDNGSSAKLYVMKEDGIETEVGGGWYTYTPTWTGFSAAPSGGDIEYFLQGKLCTVHIQSAAGTSNATTTTVTLPFNAAGVNVFSPIIVNNGTQAAGRLQTAAGSNVATCYATPAAGAWTASGSKNVQIASFTYRID